MAGYDGSIRIDTKINTEKASAQLMSLESRIKKTADKVAALRSKMDALKNVKVPTQEYTEIQSQIEKTSQKLAILRERKEKFISTGGSENTAVFRKMEYDIAELKGTLESARGELEYLVSEGKAFTLGSNSQEYAKMEQQLGYLTSDYATLIQRRDEFIQKNNSNTSTSAYERLSASLQKLKSAAKSAFSAATKAVSVFASGIKKTGAAVKGIATKILSIGKNARTASSGISSMKSGFVSMIKSALGISSIFMIFQKLRTAVKDGFENLAQVSKPVNGALSSLKSSLTQLKNSLATAFSPILTAIAPALTTLINLASKAATAVGMLIAALTGQKSFTKATSVQEGYADSLKKTSSAAKKATKSLAGFDKLNVLNNNDSDDSSGDGGSGGVNAGDMFETVDIPSQIGDLADMIKKAWEKADFTEIGALIGQKLKTALDSIDWEPIKATAAKVGKSLATLINGFVEVDGLADSIGKTIGEAINTGIAGINAFLDNTHWDSVGKFIGEGLNGLVDTIDWGGLGHMFAQGLNAAFDVIGNAAKTFDWTKFGKNIAKSINTFIKDFNWEENGANLSALITGLLDTIKTLLKEVDWGSLGTGIADFLNAIDWKTIFEDVGESIGLALNAIFDTLGSFAEDFDWAEFGSSVGGGITKAITTFDWANAGASLASMANGLLTALKGVLDGTDWKSLGKGIVTAVSSFFGNIDWGTVGGGIASFATSIFSFLTGLIQGVDWGGIPKKILTSISSFFKGADYKKLFGSIGELIGTAIASGIDLIKGIGDVLGDIGKKVKDYFVGKFKEAGFSEDAGLLENGKAIITGLFNGILDALKSVGAWVKTNIFDPFITGFKNAFGIHSPSTVMSDQGGYIISGLLSGLKSNISSVLEWLKNIPTWFKKKFDKAYSSAKSAFSGIGDWFGDRWTDIKDAFSNVKSWFSSKFSGAWGKIEAAFKISTISEFFGNVWSNIKSSFGNIAKWFKGEFSAAWTAVKNVFSKGGKVFSGIKDGILSGLKTVINALISGINKVIKIPFDGINAALKKIKDIKIVGKKPFDFLPTIDVPQIPKLASGAVIRGGDPFMAVLGDQPKSQTNIETPLPTMVKAFKQALAETGGTGGGDITVQAVLDGKVIYENTVKQNNIEIGRTGKNRLAY